MDHYSRRSTTAAWMGSYRPITGPQTVVGEDGMQRYSLLRFCIEAKNNLQHDIFKQSRNITKFPPQCYMLQGTDHQKSEEGGDRKKHIQASKVKK